MKQTYSSSILFIKNATAHTSNVRNEYQTKDRLVPVIYENLKIKLSWKKNIRVQNIHQRVYIS